MPDVHYVEVGGLGIANDLLALGRSNLIRAWHLGGLGGWVG
jgi:hypothetical protein